MVVLIYIVSLVIVAFAWGLAMEWLGLTESREYRELRQIELEQERLGFEEWNRRIEAAEKRKQK